MISYMLAVIILMAIPGPALLTIFGIGAAFGYAAGIRYVIGIYIGANLVALIAFSGLSTALLQYPGMRTLLMGVSLTFLIYLAFRIAFAGSNFGQSKNAAPPGIRSGIILQLVNPKAYMTVSALYLSFPIMPDTPLTEAIVKLGLANIVWIPGHFVWLYAGVRVNQLNLSQRTSRNLNIALAAAMLGLVSISVFFVNQ